MASSSLSLQPSLLVLFTFFLASFCRTFPPMFLLVPLNHTLFQTQSRKPSPPIHHLLKLSSTRSAARFRSFSHQHNHQPVPLTAGSDYTLPLRIGHQIHHVYLDTGSDVVWLPCARFLCILCEDKRSPLSQPFAHSSSLSVVPCNSIACSTAHSSASCSDLCAIAGCNLENLEMGSCHHPCAPFYYAYADGSLIARLVSSDLRLPGFHLRNFTFGCAHSALAEPVGVAGFGRGVLSLPAQLSTRHFSYCLIPHRFSSSVPRRPSSLLLGRKPSGDCISYTPMLENPGKPYLYYVGLEGMFVGNRWIEAPESLRAFDSAGNGGLVVDSGTTFTMLPAKLFHRVEAEFVLTLGKTHQRAGDVEEASGLGPCFYVDEKNRMTSVPKLVLVFRGNASVELLKESYFFPFEKKRSQTHVAGGKTTGCFLIVGTTEGEEDDGPDGVLGNFQQQNLEVIFDLEKRRIGFEPRDCGSMWDSF